MVGITSRLRVVLYKSRFHILSLLKRKVTCSGLLVFCGCLVYRISERFSSQFAQVSPSLCNPNPWGIGLWIFSYEFLFALDTYVQIYRRFQSSTIVTYLIISAVQINNFCSFQLWPWGALSGQLCSFDMSHPFCFVLFFNTFLFFFFFF